MSGADQFSLNNSFAKNPDEAQIVSGSFNIDLVNCVSIINLANCISNSLL